MLDLFIQQYDSLVDAQALESAPPPLISPEGGGVSKAPKILTTNSLLYDRIKQRIKLRKYQIEAVKAFDKSPNHFGLINLFCGLGKTKVMLSIISLLRPSTLLICFPTAELIEQFINELTELYYPSYKLIHLVKEGQTSQTIKFLNTIKDKRKLITPVIVLSTYSSSERLKRHINFFDLVCLDECHNMHTEHREFLNERRHNLLKLTATVHNADFKDIIYYKSAKTAIQEGYVQDYEIDCIFYRKQQSKQAGERYRPLLTKVIDLCKKKKKKRIIIFDRYVKLTKSQTPFSVVEEFQNLEIEDAQLLFIRSEDSLQDRQKTINYFMKEDDTIKIIFNANILREGIDIRSCDAVVFLDPRQSFNLIIQNIGRCLRKKESASKSLIIVPIQMATEVQMREAQKFKDICELLRSSQYANKLKNLFWVLGALKKVDDRINEKHWRQRISLHTSCKMPVQKRTPAILQF